MVVVGSLLGLGSVVALLVAFGDEKKLPVLAGNQPAKEAGETPEVYALRLKADSGDVDAMTRLAAFYWRGEVVTRDVKKAKYWLKRAVESGDGNTSADAVVALDRIDAWEQQERAREQATLEAQEARERQREREIEQQRAQKLAAELEEKKAAAREKAAQERELARRHAELRKRVLTARKTMEETEDPIAIVSAITRLKRAPESSFCTPEVESAAKEALRNADLHRKRVCDSQVAEAFRFGDQGELTKALAIVEKLKAALSDYVPKQLTDSAARWRKQLKSEQKKKSDAEASRLAQAAQAEAEAARRKQRLEELRSQAVARATLHYQRRLPDNFRCSPCDSTGAVTHDDCDGRGRKRCSSCSGSGRVTCSKCSGSGQKIVIIVGPGGGSRTESCGYCRGSGRRGCGGCSASGMADCWCTNGKTDCDSCSDGYSYSGLEGAFLEFLSPSTLGGEARSRSSSASARAKARKRFLDRLAKNALKLGDSVYVRGGQVTGALLLKNSVAISATVTWADGTTSHVETAWILRRSKFYLATRHDKVREKVAGDSPEVAAERKRSDQRGAGAKEGGLARELSESIVLALRWLKRHQSPDGRWDSDGWTANCGGGHGCAGPGTALGAQRYDAGQTALALLAFIGSGHTHRAGEFKESVAKGLQWLKRQQKVDGSIGFDRGETIYNHALATRAICEAYAASRDDSLRSAAVRAIEFCLRAQNPGSGWKYGIRSKRNDTSVTGWMVLALQAGKAAGIDVPVGALEGARKWFVSATSTRGETGYETPAGGSAFLPQNDGKYDPTPCMTAVSVLCRLSTGERPSGTAFKNGFSILSKTPPVWWKGTNYRTVNFYYWYYGTYAMSQAGEDYWKQWSSRILLALPPNQRADGCAAGSWDPVGEWCLAGGRVYATAINALTSLKVHDSYKSRQ